MLADAIAANPDVALLIGGLAIGALYGIIVHQSGFCVMGAVSDAALFQDLRRMRMVAIAAATAIALTTLLRFAGTVDVTRSIYLSNMFDWLGAAAGGLIFGAGMVLAGGCISRNLVRAGSGDLRAAITAVVTGLAAYATMGGVLGWPRDAVQSATRIDLTPYGFATQGMPDLITGATGLDAKISLALAAVLITAVLMAFACASQSLRTSRQHIVAGAGVGALVAAAWALTGLSYDEFALAPVATQGLSFVRPTGDAIEWIKRATAIGWPGFGAATVFGTILGGALAAVSTRRFRVSGFTDTNDLVRHIAGAFMMGIGGVLALGCSIGNGITGVSTLSLSAFVATAAILAGARLCIGYLEHQA